MSASSTDPAELTCELIYDVLHVQIQKQT